MKSTVKRAGTGKNIDSKLQMIKIVKTNREAIEEKLEKSVADLTAKIKE